MIIEITTANPGKVLGTVLGLLIGILFVVIGFWRTVLIVGCAVVGFIIGNYRDRGIDFRRLIKKWFWGDSW